MTAVPSTFAFQAIQRRSLLDLQRDLVRDQQELNTGRHFDLSLSQGANVGRLSLLDQRLTDIRNIAETNKTVSARLETSAVALSSLKETATDVRDKILLSLTHGQSLAVVKQQAAEALSALVNTMNSSNGGDFIFSGTKIDIAPLNQFETQPPSPAKLAIDRAFFDAFGVSQDNPAVAGIPKADMEAFLKGSFADLFDDAAWRTNWSNASDTPITSRISLFRTTNTSVTANDPALRNLAMGYAALSQLALEGVSPQAAQSILESALGKIDQGMSGIASLQTSIGSMQSNVNTEANTLAIQQNYLIGQTRAIESVDQTEVAARINSLMTQLETAYTLTAKLQQMSLTRFI